MHVTAKKSYFCECCRKQAASDFYNDKLLSQTLQQWQLCARWSRDSGWKEDLAFGHRAETLLLKCMEGWHLVRDFCLVLLLHDLEYHPQADTPTTGSQATGT